MGDNSIHYMGHVKMMSAVQPFLSGAISKTVNMPEEATVADVEQLHIEAWKLGLKAVAIYRDNCKVAQPLSMAKKEVKATDQPAAAATTEAPVQEVQAVNDRIVLKGAVRRRLPKVRKSKTFSFTVADSHGFLTVGEYEDGTPGELFINFAKHGSTLRGIMDAFAISVSHGLQYGVPLKAYVKSLSNTSFAPSGITDDAEIRTASSLIDYIFRRLALSYLNFDDRLELGLASIDDMPSEDQTSLLQEEVSNDAPKNPVVDEEIRTASPSDEVTSASPVATSHSSTARPQVSSQDDASPLCFNCGNQTQRSGSCYVCTSCGSTTGCS